MNLKRTTIFSVFAIATSALVGCAGESDEPAQPVLVAVNDVNPACAPAKMKPQGFSAAEIAAFAANPATSVLQFDANGRLLRSSDGLPPLSAAQVDELRSALLASDGALGISGACTLP